MSGSQCINLYFRTAMAEELKDHILKFIPISDAEFTTICSYFEQVRLKKKQDLQKAGTLCRCDHFVVKGCLRMYFVNDKGVEQTVQFAIEHWWLSDYAAFIGQTNATFSIQALEATDVLSITQAAQEALLTECPRMERYFRCVHQRAHAAAQFRIRMLHSLSREELYLHFSKNFPEFVQRVPQYLLASYLGFTPEYLSAIRRRIS